MFRYIASFTFMAFLSGCATESVSVNTFTKPQDLCQETTSRFMTDIYWGSTDITAVVSKSERYALIGVKRFISKSPCHVLGTVYPIEKSSFPFDKESLSNEIIRNGNLPDRVLAIYFTDLITHFSMRGSEKFRGHSKISFQVIMVEVDWPTILNDSETSYNISGLFAFKTARSLSNDVRFALEETLIHSVQRPSDR